MIPERLAPPIALQVRHLSKTFGGLKAVRDVSFGVAHGARRAIIGPNGAGKTTLFNLVAGDLPATSGTVHLFDRDVTRMSVRRRVRLGLRRTYQTPALLGDLTAQENLYLAVLGGYRPKRHFDVFRRASADHSATEKVLAMAETVGLADHLAALASELAHGQRRQLEIGMAVINSPRLLLLDEPASGLSTVERQAMLDVLRSLGSDMTIVLIEHDMEIALGFGDVVTVLHEGQLLAEGHPEEIRDDEEVQRVYLGASFRA
jgi:branched-chain amino acid transport system ATP-binding protein